ncbi:hypothetical protein TH30_13035 [Thalassospira profundimaris]|uniref:Uncharacterized protein n=2 Tax=Thalassospira profundimaris TaxID=502049 RepID=A0A367WVK6_9PROT|nr:hypothetical protein TH30_13035 [Thalassospira profundimaris]
MHVVRVADIRLSKKSRPENAPVSFANQGVLGAHADFSGTVTAFRKLIRQAVRNDGAEIVILGGAVTAGMKQQLENESPAPILEGVDCAVRLVEQLWNEKSAPSHDTRQLDAP